MHRLYHPPVFGSLRVMWPADYQGLFPPVHQRGEVVSSNEADFQSCRVIILITSKRRFLEGFVCPALSASWTTVIPKIGPRAYIFQKPFLRGLFLEGLILGGAYVWREICVSKSIGLACRGKEINYHFCFVLRCIRGQIPSTSLPGSLYSEGRFNGGFFALRFWGVCIWRGLFSEFYDIYFFTHFP